MRHREQKGQIIRIGDHWYVRYWERRNIGGSIERNKVTHELGAAHGIFGGLGLHKIPE